LRITQDRTPIGCFWAVAIAWAVLSVAFPNTGILANEKWWLDVAVVTALFLTAIYFTIERRLFAASVLVLDAPPEPGHGLRGKIETPLKSEVPCKVRVGLMRSQRRRDASIWKTEVSAHPIRSEKGLILPVEVMIPAEVAKSIDSTTYWTVRASARMLPILYRASFTLPRTPWVTLNHASRDPSLRSG